MNIEEHLLSCLVRTRDMQAVSAAKITAEYFFDEQHRRVFEYIVKHFTQYGEVPLASHIKANWPTYRMVKVEHGIAYYLDEIRRKYLHHNLTLTVADITEELENRNPAGALQILQQDVGRLSLLDSRMVDVDLAATYEARLEEYEEARGSRGSLRGISTGFPSLDKATLGYQPEQFIIILGLPKAGKSTMLLASALAVHSAHRRVLLIGFEMSNQEQAARYDAIAAKVDHLRLLSGDIGARDIKRLEATGEQRAKLPPFISSTDISAGATISSIAAKIEQHNPEVVFIDGLYLMDDELGEPKGSPAALTNISRGCKRLAQVKRVPIVGTTQALHSKVRRVSGGLQASSAGYTSAFQQDCDAMIGVEALDEPNFQRGKLLLNRIGPRVEFDIEWDWTTGTFNEVELDEDAGT